jgi:hypothetical protein
MTEQPTPAEQPNGPSDPVRLLTRLRPDSHLDDEWDATRRDAVLAGILDAQPEWTRVGWVSRHRRLVLAGAVAACAAVVAAGLVLPDGSPGGPDAAAAATLNRLAVTAGTSGSEVGPGQYAYTDSREVQRFSAADVAHGTPAITSHAFRTWTAPSGDSWQLQGGCLQRFPHDSTATAAGGNYGGLTSEQYAKLPTAPGALATYLDEHPSGDNRGALNRFVSVGDLVGDPLTGAKLRAAAIRVLAHTSGITVEQRSRDALGRDAIEVDYTYSMGPTVSALFFAPNTSALLETQSRVHGSVDYRSVVRASRIVDSLPHQRTCS